MMHLYKVVYGDDWRKFHKIFVEAANKVKARDRILKVYGMSKSPFFLTQVPDRSMKLFKKVFTVI